MHLCVFEDEDVPHLLPLVYTRAVYDLRLGVRRQLRALRDAFGSPGTLLHSRRLVAAVTGRENDLVANSIPEGLDVLFVNGRWIVKEDEVLRRIRSAAKESEGRLFTHRGRVLAAWVPGAAQRFVAHDAVTADLFDGLPTEQIEDARMIERLWDLTEEIEPAIRRDYQFLTAGRYVFERPGVTVNDGAVLHAGERIRIGPGTVVRPGAILNAERGPIFIGDDAEIKEGAVIKGPAYVGSRSVIMSSADIQCAALGYNSKVGGQVEDSVIHSLSNKAHSGYLGHAYIGRWCNLGANTNVSNLRNDYGETKMYDAADGELSRTGRSFLGLVMGDHSKSGINTMFNTATVVGVCCNVFGAGFMARCIPSFSWGGPESFSEYRLASALEVADVVMKRRERALTDDHRENLEQVFEASRGETVRR
jgi:UDP-N-acetylglucosamine diphosphorylase/glucosamine-1-phosphate N-acetyltransferase